MPPKGGAKGKAAGKGKPAEEEKKGAGKVKGAQQINVRHILCEKHAKKEEALAKLKVGAKFDEVAREFSEDKAKSGGSLGWKSRGDLVPEFANVAFELEASTVGNPKYAEVKTEHGYHIIMVDARK